MIGISIFLLSLTFAGVIAAITHPLFMAWSTQKEAYKIKSGDQAPQERSKPLFVQILTCKLRNSMGGSLRGLIYTYRLAMALVIAAALYAAFNL